MAKLQPDEIYVPPLLEEEEEPPAPQPWLREYGIPRDLWHLFEEDEYPFWEWTDEPEPPPAPPPMPPLPPGVEEERLLLPGEELTIPPHREQEHDIREVMREAWDAITTFPPTRWAGALVGKGLRALAIPAEKTKQAIGALQYLLDSGVYEDARWRAHPLYGELMEMERLPLEERIKPEVRRRHAELVARIQADVYEGKKFAPKEIYELVRADAERWEEAWREGEGFRYTHWIKPERWLEYERLRSQGVSPRKAGDATADWGIETLGEIILDPLNLLQARGWQTLYGKGLRGIYKWLKRTTPGQKVFQLSKASLANLAFYRAQDAVQTLAHLLPEGTVDDIAHLVTHVDDTIAEALPLRKASYWRQTAELLDSAEVARLAKRCETVDELAEQLARLAYQTSAQKLGLSTKFTLRGDFFARAKGIFTELWLGSRPAWVINNAIDNTFKMVVEGVTPFGHIDDVIVEYERAFGALPAEVPASLARGLRTPVFREGHIPGLRRYVQKVFKVHDKMEAAARTRIFLNRFGWHYDRAMRGAEKAVRRAGLSDEVAEVVVARLRGRRWWNANDLDDVLKSLAKEEVPIYRVDLLPDGLEIIPDNIRGVVRELIHRKVDRGAPLTLDDIDDAFSRALKVLDADHTRRVNAARSAVLQTLEVPTSPRRWVQSATEAFDLTTKDGVINALDDLGRYRAMQYAKDKAALDDFIRALEDLPPAKRGEEWEKFLRRRRGAWKRFNKRERQAYKLFLDELDPELAAELEPHIDDLLAAHEGMKDFFSFQAARYHDAARRSLGQSPLRAHRIWRAAEEEVYFAERAMLAPLKQQAAEAWAQIRGVLTSSTRLAGDVTPELSGSSIPWFARVDEMVEATRAQEGVTREIAQALDAWYDDIVSTRLEPVRTLHPSPDDIQKLEQLRRSLVPRLREGFDKAVEYGLDETNRILFDYARNYRWDDLAEQLVPYWKWPSRNILQAVDSHLRHPKVWWLIYRTRDHVASVNKEAGLRTRLKYTVHVPGYSAAVGSLLRYMGLEEHIEARIDPFRYVSWLGSLPGSTPYKQRELERLRQEREEGPAPIIEQARRLGEQFGIGLYPWWEFTLGYMGVFGDDWYPRQVIPWSRTIEYFTGVNPDYLFHKASTTILSELGVPRMLTKGYNALGISPPKVDLIEWGTERPDRWLNFSMGRRARNQLIRQYLDGVPPRDIKVDVNKAREDALTLAFVSEALGHATGLYFKEWSVEEAVSKQMTEEYRRLPSKAARKEWYEKYPWWGEHSRSWDKFADTPDRLRRAERRQILSDFYAAYNELRDRHIRERQELFRQHPMVWWRMRKLKDAQWEEREELERQYEEKLKATLAEGETLPALWQWQLFPQKRYNKATGEWEEFYNILPEEYREHHISQLAQALSRTLPRRSWFIRDDGTFDSEGYYWAREKWFAALPGLEDYEPGPPANKTWERARRTPTPVLQSLIQRMVEAGMPGEAARQFVALGLTRDDLERAWMKNDTPEEALQSVYYDRVIKLAGERMAEIKKISDPAERAQAYEELFAAFPAMPATAFAWDIYVRYKDVKPEWTPLFLVQALQDITLPSYEDYLHNNKTGREWLISAINQLYFAQHWRNRRILREKIPALQIVAERRKYRLDHPEKNLTSSYDYDIISLGELKDVLNALEQLTGRPITEWDDIPQLAAAVPPVAAAAGLVAAARPEPEAYEGIIPTREGAPPPTLPPTEGVPPRMPPPRAGGVVITWPTDKTEFVELTTDEITGDESLLGKYGVARLYTPEELAEANEAQRINELAWAAKEAGNDEEAEKWFSHPLWIKWYGNTPKSRFWREYRRLVPPGWRGRPLRETDIIQTILNKGLRAFLSDEAYEEGLRLIQEYAATYPHLIEGDPEEWEQAKRMAEEYFSIEDPEERKEYAAAHPLFVKYYFAPPGWPESRFARERKKPTKKERLERGELAAQQATAPQDPAEFTEVTTDEITGAALLAAYGLVPLLTPDELKEAQEAQRINEKAWAAREAGNDEEADKWFSHPLWVKWYGNTPKSRFWREYRRLVPPGWRGKPLRQTPIIATILDKGMRAFLKDETYEEALKLIYAYAETYPDLIEGDPEEWEQAKEEAQQFFLIPAEDKEARDKFVEEHPIFAKYYTGTPPGWIVPGGYPVSQAPRTPSAPQSRSSFAELETDEVTGTAETKYGLIRLLSPDELAEAMEAQRINEAAWAARERGDHETANELFKHPLWIKWYGRTPKALFWREYRRLVPPGWRGKPVRDHPLVANILDKGMRAFLRDEAYEAAVQLIYEWRDTYPNLLEGTPEEWERAKQEAQEYYNIPPENREARQEFIATHPLFAKYYTGAPPGWGAQRGYDYRRGRWTLPPIRPYAGGTAWGWRRTAYYVPSRRRFMWAEFAADAGPVIINFLEGYWSGRRKMTAKMRAALEALYHKYGYGMSFEAWLDWLRGWWLRFGRTFRAPRRPRLPLPRPTVTRRRARGAGAVARGVPRPRL